MGKGNIGIQQISLCDMEKDLNDQNTSIQAITEKALQLKYDTDQDRAIVTELESKVKRLEENVTDDANTLRNITSRLRVIDYNMTVVNDMIRTQYDSIVELTVNLTTFNTESYATTTRLSDLEAKANEFEATVADQDGRIGQLESVHLSNSLLNQEQKTQLNELENEINKTWTAIQDFSSGSTGIHYINVPMQYTTIFHGCKNDNFQLKLLDYFHIFAQNIDCGYTLEPPQ